MPLPEIFGAPYPVQIEGKRIDFSLLKMVDIAAVAKVVELAREKRTEVNAKRRGLSKEDTAKLVALVEAEQIDVFHVYKYAGTLEGSIDVAKRSLVLGGMKDDEADVTVSKIDDPVLLKEIAEYVIGYVRLKPPEDRQATNPCPTGGESSGSGTAG